MSLPSGYGLSGDAPVLKGPVLPLHFLAGWLPLTHCLISLRQHVELSVVKCIRLISSSSLSADIVPDLSHRVQRHEFMGQRLDL